jgi:hypothetical protein
VSSKPVIKPLARRVRTPNSYNSPAYKRLARGGVTSALPLTEQLQEATLNVEEAERRASDEIKQIMAGRWGMLIVIDDPDSSKFGSSSISTYTTFVCTCHPVVELKQG